MQLAAEHKSQTRVNYPILDIIFTVEENNSNKTHQSIVDNIKNLKVPFR